jgi:integrating conjugative element protein (TIGR03749 family)
MKTVLILCLGMMTTLPGGAQALTSGAVPLAVMQAVEQTTLTTEQHPDRQVWRGTPIRVNLPLNSEHIIRFPGATALRSGLLGGPVPGLRVQVLDDHIYLLAKEPFAATRMIVQTGSGPAVLLDLAADERFPSTAPLDILTAAPSGSDTADGGWQPDGAATQETARPTPVGYVSLIRHAAQSLYAPPRLIPRGSAIVQAPLPNRGPVALMRGLRLLATPVASWRTEGPQGPLWVTGVKLRNLSRQPVVLDPRDLRGQWRAASFQHARLGAFGDETDTTTVYLISDHRFAKAVEPWLPVHTEVSAP